MRWNLHLQLQCRTKGRFWMPGEEIHCNSYLHTSRLSELYVRYALYLVRYSLCNVGGFALDPSRAQRIFSAL